MTNSLNGRFTKRIFFAGLLLLFVALTSWDLYGPRAVNIRDFDPVDVAQLDSAMWRSYYDRQRLLLFRQLAELLRIEFRLPYLRSYSVAFSAARGAFLFKEGQSRSDYEKALPSLISFYTGIRKVSATPFDVERAARLELEWWIVHRQRDLHAPGDLERALAALASEFYQLPADRFLEHGRLRAEAMQIRDSQAAKGRVTEEDWKQISALLQASWQSLRKAVNQQR